MLTEAGLTIVDPPGEHALTADDLRNYLPECAGVVAGGEPYTEELIAACLRLRIIARTGVGYDAVDVEAATGHGVVVTITPGANHDSVAEQAFGLLLAVTRRIAWNDRIVRAGGWDRTLVMPLRGKTLGLVGVGRIGRAMIPRAQAFGMNVIAHDPVARQSEGLASGVRLVEFEALLAESDVVSLHCPLTPSTRRWFDESVLGRMRFGSILINTARGGVVDEAALHAALKRGHLAGAGLDVMDPEPPRPSNPLISLQNVVISPHIAGIDTLAMADMAEMAAQSIVDHLRGSVRKDCVVNPEVLESA